MAFLQKYFAKKVKRLKHILFRLGYYLQKDPDTFLKNAIGVIHVGAHIGQEKDLYAKYSLPVIWIEPIDQVFESLKENIIGCPNQVAIQGLITDVDDAEYTFNLASNYGASSSILDLNLHRDIWPHVRYDKKINLRSSTLCSILESNNIDTSRYDTLVMDTQGSELLVLKGALPILLNFTYIKTEVADFESYKDCCQLRDIEAFLLNYGYKEFARRKFIKHPDGGGYYDIVYKR
jgi:FkbM family methyltransferase